ncbi:MAG: asparagine synthase (glutamine-hydrolyzing) [Candidatus Tectomicrobia bacterium]|uniref:asparagine synthase (glutamine-hydrolyzing) n=1 Tax=Tectimicrobiota bacterium TaxID=2528274 RepID=A0A932HVX7_UNCTE|nr:asparagine synthase (glutamine-hydrolyzing) [Candidatus Tectomicrobia bacterium]
MCGIAGILGAPDLEVMERMLLKIAHRGPDDGHVLADDRIVLGARRLSIIDVEGGRQPVTNEDGTVWAALNGEIYNAAALRRRLEVQGHRFHSRVDTEVLVHLYEREGEGLLSLLDGMFAIAIWDQQRKRLLLARDRLGIKPLYLHQAPGGKIAFASEMKALLLCPWVSRGIDFAALNDFFSFKHVPSPKTIYSGIRCLRPGNCLIAEEGSVRRSQYWKVRYQENERMTADEAAEGIFARLDEAVRSHMVSDVPIGAYLSGGMDSSAVVALMSRHSSRPVMTFSLGYEDGFKNKEADLHHARLMSQRFGTAHHECILSYQDLIESLDAIVSAFDEPFAGVISTYFITRLISRHVKVALSGDGADEIFGSYLPHRLAQPIAYFRKRFGGHVLSHPLNAEDRQELGAFAGQMDFLASLAREEGWRWRHRLSVFPDQEKRQLFSPAIQDEMADAQSLATMGEWYGQTTARDPLNEVLEVECSHILPDQVLAFVDRLSMAHSVEVRPPFVDHRLVEFAATIPGRLKMQNGRVKHILKEALAQVLPPEVVNRPKEGFVMPIHQWMPEKLRPFVEETLAPERLGLHGFFQGEYVARLLADRPDGGHLQANKLWMLTIFQLWYERYIH